MAATFAATPDEFFSQISTTQYASNVVTPGRNNLGGIIGTDGNDYVVLQCSNVGGSPKTCFAIWNIRTGDFHNYTDDDLTAFFGISVPQSAAAIPVNGTPYVWIFWTEGTAHATFIWRGRIVSVDAVDSISIPPSVSPLDVETQSLESWGDSNVRACYYNPTTGMYRVFLSPIRHGTVSEHIDVPIYFDIPTGEHDILSGFSEPIQSNIFDVQFFDFLSGTLSPYVNDGAFSIACSPEGDWFGLFYIGADQWDYIQANPAASVVFPLISGVGLYRYDFPTSITLTPPVSSAAPDSFNWWSGNGEQIRKISGVTFADSDEHLDGTRNSTINPPSRPVDDYQSLNVYNFINFPPAGGGSRRMSFADIGNVQYLDFPSMPVTDDNTYIAMVRSYTTTGPTGDIAFAGTGTYIRVKIIKYRNDNPLVATLILDEQYSIFDLNLDLGAPLGEKFFHPPLFVQTVMTANKDYFYIWGNPSIAGFEGGIFTAGRVVHTDDFVVDLVASGRQAEINFISELDTWWTLSEQASLWAENPWLITYVDNTDTDPSLLMTPRWEWTESDMNHKSGPQVEVFKDRTGTVSDYRNRVRGKGRALQLHFESTIGKPWNLLGWSVNLDKNAQY